MAAPAVCITGMRRSGRSMVARALRGKDPRTEPSRAAARATVAASRRRCAPEAAALERLAAKAAAIDELWLQLRQQTKRAQRAEECVAGLENSLTFRYTGLFRMPLAAVRRPRGG